jgi:MATE family, multidrug efflux pump
MNNITAKRPKTIPRDWTQGSVIRNLFSLSWPIMIHNSLYMVGQTVDMIWMGRLGSNAVAGVGAVFIVFMLVLTGKMGLATGARAMITRSIGSGNIEQASHLSVQAFVLSIVYGIFFTILGVIFAHPILTLFGLKPEVISLGTDYMRVLFGGWIFYSIWIMAFSIMQASGDAKTPMFIHMFTRCIQIILSPCLIFGWWIFPEVGVAGAAFSQMIGQVLGMCISLWILFRGGQSQLKLTIKGFRIDIGSICRMIKIGLPALFMGIQSNLGQTVLMWIIAPYGTIAVAGHSLNQRVEMFIQMPAVGLGTGAGILVGQDLGAKKPRQAESIGWTATALMEGFFTIFAVAVLLGAPYIMRIFTPESELINTGSNFLRIACAGYLLSGLTISLQNSISGSGDTLPPMIISMVSVWLVLLPAAYLLPRVTNLDVYGIRWAMIISHAFSAIVYTLYFRNGKWKRKEV